MIITQFAIYIILKNNSIYLAVMSSITWKIEALGTDSSRKENY